MFMVASVLPCVCICVYICTVCTYARSSIKVFPTQHSAMPCAVVLQMYLDSSPLLPSLCTITYTHTSTHFQDNDRSLLGRHDSKAMDTCLGDDNGVQLIGIRTLSTGEDSIEVTSDLPSPVSLTSSGDDSMDPSVATAITEVSASGQVLSDSGQVLSDSVEEEEEGGDGAAGKAGGEEEGVGDGGRGGSGAKEEEEEEGERDVKLKKRGSELAIENAQKQALDDVEEQLAPNKSSRNPRKSVLKRTQPTPVHSGPTYTCTSPVGEPYDSDGDRRQQTGQECCSVM